MSSVSLRPPLTRLAVRIGGHRLWTIRGQLPISNHMVTTQMLDRTFQALSDPTRRGILALLAEGDATVGQLAEPFPVSRPAISKHLRVLEAAGLVHRLADGRRRRCSFHAAPLQEASAWVNQYRKLWETQLQALSEYLEPKTPQPGEPG